MRKGRFLVTEAAMGVEKQDGGSSFTEPSVHHIPPWVSNLPGPSLPSGQGLRSLACLRWLLTTL